MNKLNPVSALTSDTLPPFVYLRPRSFQGSLRAEKGIPLPLDESLLLREGDDLRLKGFLQLLAPSRPHREHLHIFAQSGYLQLGLLDPLLSCRPLHVLFVVGAGELDP